MANLHYFYPFDVCRRDGKHYVKVSLVAAEFYLRTTAKKEGG